MNVNNGNSYESVQTKWRVLTIKHFLNENRMTKLSVPLFEGGTSWSRLRWGDTEAVEGDFSGTTLKQGMHLIKCIITQASPFTCRITKFYEKPSASETASHLASVIFYCFRKNTLKKVVDYIAQYIQVNDRNFGKFMVNQFPSFYLIPITT